MHKAILLIGCTIFFSYAQVTTMEYQIKAAFVYNITQFVEWPSHSFQSSKSPAVIGILGTDPFGNYLQELIAGEAIDLHPLMIKHFSSVEEITNCQILYININDKKLIQTITEKIKGKNILTISDSNRFSRIGGMIRLYTKDDKVHIEINLEATKEENLIISSKLLKLSQIVTTDVK